MSSTPTKHSPAEARAAARKLHSLLRDPHSPAKKEGAPARGPESSAMASASSPVGLPVEELMSCLKAVQAQATTNTEVGTTAIALGTKALEGLDNLASVVQDNRNDHDNLRRAHDALAANVNNVNVQMDHLRGRAAASGATFGFDDADPGSDQGAAASGSFGAGATSVASAPGGGFGSGTTAGFAAPGTLSLGAAAAASGPFAGTTAVLGSDNAASLKSSSSGGSIPTFGAGAGSAGAGAGTNGAAFGAGAGSAGAGAGTNGAGFSFDGPTSGSFGTLKNSAPSAAPSVSFGIGTQDPSLKDAVGFQQVSISTFFLSC